ncbi:uncharacterized protein LOC133805939 [Humulus lupulus]|uniref:uncharacterized protein LOC133805939 n=1 Tax=Humulus lupulus TaxID=3486 RepID=UPI002B40A8B5|nr:uncharacterized protein LOC133805939 [Humulus lupulus]
MQQQQSMPQASSSQQFRPPVPQEKPNELQATLLTLKNTQTQFMKETRSSIRNLETHTGQLASMLNNRPQGNLPSNTVANPKEQCQAITLRSGKEYEVEPQAEQKVTEDLASHEKTQLVSNDPDVRISYPQRLQKTTLDKQFSKFLDVFKKLHINIPFGEALEQMPNYVKFMKEILSKKWRMEDYETVALTEECRAILQRKLPQKLQDPGIIYPISDSE